MCLFGSVAIDDDSFHFFVSILVTFGHTVHGNSVICIGKIWNATNLHENVCRIRKNVITHPDQKNAIVLG